MLYAYRDIKPSFFPFVATPSFARSLILQIHLSNKLQIHSPLQVWGISSLVGLLPLYPFFYSIQFLPIVCQRTWKAENYVWKITYFYRSGSTYMMQIHGVALNLKLLMSSTLELQSLSERSSSFGIFTKKAEI